MASKDLMVLKIILLDFPVVQGLLSDYLFIFFNGAFHYTIQVGFSKLMSDYIIKNAPWSWNFK